MGRIQTPTPWSLQTNRALSPTLSGPSEPDQYRFDSAHPTPSLKGVALLNGGPTDQRSVDRQPDVLIYTSDVLDHDIEVIDPIQAELYVQSNLAHPRSALNPGTGEPLAKAVILKTAEQTVYHDPARPSNVILNILKSESMRKRV
jgi:predicted acyl esterase